MNEKNTHTVYEEKIINGGNGMLALVLSIIICVASLPVLFFGAYLSSDYGSDAPVLIALVIMLLMIGVSVLIWCGLKVVKPNEALVLTLFGKYHGTIKGENFALVNPFCQAINPTLENDEPSAAETAGNLISIMNGKPKKKDSTQGKKISLKSITLDNGKQKINDQMGNPIEIGIVVIWRVVNTAKAVFSVDNYMEYLSIQADSALRNIVRLYPYDTAEGGDEKSLRGSSQEVSEKLKQEIQEKVNIAGLEVIEARITHLAYAPEIAAAMLQRQQASAIIDAKKMIVEGAVGMVDMALQKLNEKDIVDLDEERKAAMVSNLLVVLCGSKEAQPVVNSGSLY